MDSMMKLVLDSLADADKALASALADRDAYPGPDSDDAVEAASYRLSAVRADVARMSARK